MGPGAPHLPLLILSRGQGTLRRAKTEPQSNLELPGPMVDIVLWEPKKHVNR